MTNNQRKWLDALRGGKYPQTRAVLRRPDEVGNGFCCLGVLCDISGEGGWDMENALSHEGIGYITRADGIIREGISTIDVLPDVIHWAALDAREPFRRPGYKTVDSGHIPWTAMLILSDAMSRNDRGDSFEEIAEWLEDEVFTADEAEIVT